MKKASIAFLILTSAWIFPACNSSDTSTTTTSTADSLRAADSLKMATNTAPVDTTAANNTPVTKESSDFVAGAASGGMMEVELGKMAQQQAKSQRVKDFASMIVADHTKANNELKALASSKNVTVPTAMMPDHQKHVDMMKGKTGADFDKEYISMMVNDHKEDIAAFKKEATSSNKDVFQGFAANALPVLQKHLDSAQAIHGSK